MINFDLLDVSSDKKKNAVERKRDLPWEQATDIHLIMTRKCNITNSTFMYKILISMWYMNWKNGSYRGSPDKKFEHRSRSMVRCGISWILMLSIYWTCCLSRAFRRSKSLLNSCLTSADTIYYHFSLSKLSYPIKNMSFFGWPTSVMILRRLLVPEILLILPSYAQTLLLHPIDHTYYLKIE